MGFTAFVLLPFLQLADIDPTADRFGYSHMQQRGRDVYLSEGCAFCHTQQVRAAFYGSDVERGWGSRGSMPGDYVFDSPALLGRQRLGPDLHDVGSRLEDQNDVLAHLYQPRAFQASSVMPSYRYLFDLKPTTSVLPSETVVTVDTTVAPAEGYSIVAREEAIALSAYLASLTLN
jgi:cytochrome c oxidase cbb3-type subunit 2